MLYIYVREKSNTPFSYTVYMLCLFCKKAYIHTVTNKYTYYRMNHTTQYNTRCVTEDLSKY